MKGRIGIVDNIIAKCCPVLLDLIVPLLDLVCVFAAFRSLFFFLFFLFLAKSRHKQPPSDEQLLFFLPNKPNAVQLAHSDAAFLSGVVSLFHLRQADRRLTPPPPALCRVKAELSAALTRFRH